jgi:hypothetical protein
MRFSRIYRQKGKVPLRPLLLVSPPGTMSWRPPVHNAAGIDRNWFESCFRSHASSCGCGNFIGHLNTLAARYGFTPGPAPPPGGPGPRPPVPVRPRHAAGDGEPPRALPWRGDGGEGDAGPPTEGGAAGGAADEYRDEDLDELFAAMERDE